MPFLDAKAQLLLQYLIELANYLTGSATEKNFETLYRIRLAFQRVKNLDGKLQYSVQKLLDKAASAGEGGGNAKTSGTARPGARLAQGSILAADEKVEEGPNEWGAGEQKDEVYRPPKITAMEYGGYENSVKKAERELAREERRLKNTQMFAALREVAADGADDAVEVAGSTASGRSNEVEKLLRKQNERRAYEEDNLVRLRQTKQDKKDATRLKQLRQQGGGSEGAMGLRDLLKEVDSFAHSGEKLKSYKKAKDKVGELAAVRKEAAGAAKAGGKRGGGKGAMKGGGKNRQRR
eukprot:g14238.t1